jgi:hypothetical protein
MAMTDCEECREIAREIKQSYGQMKSLLHDTREDRLRVVEALRNGTEESAFLVEDFFAAQAPRLHPVYPSMVQAMSRKFLHERQTGHIVHLN